MAQQQSLAELLQLIVAWISDSPLVALVRISAPATHSRVQGLSDAKREPNHPSACTLSPAAEDRP